MESSGILKIFECGERKIAYREYNFNIQKKECENDEKKDGEDIIYEDDYEQVESLKKEKKTIICVHALTRNSTDFEKIGIALGAEYRVICPDIAGRGESDYLKDKEDYNYSFYTKDLLSLIDFLKIKECYWIGMSMGGILGMLVNMQRPSLIKKMILNDIAPEISSKVSLQINDYFRQNYKEFNSYEDLKKNIKKSFALFGIKKEEDWEFFAQNSLKELKNGKFIFNYDEAVLNSLIENYSEKSNLTLRKKDGMWELGDAISCPLMLIWGKLSTMLRSEVVQKFQEKKPDLFLVKIPGVGHVPNMFEKALVDIVKFWLNSNNNKHEGFSGEIILNYNLPYINNNNY